MTGVELIVFPDAEVLVGEYLQAGLAAHGRPVMVTTLAPDDSRRTGPAHAPFIRLQVIPGSGTGGMVTDDVSLIVEAYADGEAEAYALAALCRALLDAAPRTEAVAIYAADTSHPHSLPDPRTGMRRYTQNVTVRLRGTSL